MARKNDAVGTDLDKLALKILAEVLDEGVIPGQEEGKEPIPLISLNQRLEGMRIVGAYWIAKMKVEKKLPPGDDEDAPSFDAAKARLRAVT